MATYHCSVKNGSVSHAVPHAKYICREGKYATEEKKDQLVYSESGNMPDFAKDNPMEYWKAADEFTRINGRTYTEFEVALPAELTNEENIALVKAFIKQEIGDKKAYTFAIHDKPAANDKNVSQIHAHIMFSNKIQDGIERPEDKFFKRYNSKNPAKGGAKNDRRFVSLKGNEEIKIVRESLEKLVNEAYRNKGLDLQVSAKSLAEQKAIALANNDIDKAEMLDRNPQTRIDAKTYFRVMQEAAKAPNREQYFTQHKNEQVRYNYLAKQVKDLSIEVYKKKLERKLTLVENLENKKVAERFTQRQNDALKLENSHDLKEKAYEISSDLAKEKSYITKSLKVASEELKEFRKTIIREPLDEKTLNKMANDVVTNGKSIEFRKEWASNIEKNNELKKYIAEYNKLVAENPKEANNPLYKNFRNSIEKFRSEVIAKNNELRTKGNKIKAYLARPEIQKNIAEVKANIMQKHEQEQARIANRKERINNLRVMNCVLTDEEKNMYQYQKLADDKAKLFVQVEKHIADIKEIEKIEKPRLRIKAITAKMQELDKQSDYIYKSIQYTKRQTIKKEYAINAARSVYTHGEYKKYQNAVKEISKLQREIANTPNDEKRNQLNKLVAENTARKERLINVLSTDHAKQSISRMVNVRMKRNAVISTRQTVMKEHISELTSLSIRLGNMSISAQKEMERNTKLDMARSGLNDIKNGVKELFNIQEAHSKGGITASWDRGNSNSNSQGWSYDY